jgi:hypothetical protein
MIDYYGGLLPSPGAVGQPPSDLGRPVWLDDQSLRSKFEIILDGLNILITDFHIYGTIP